MAGAGYKTFNAGDILTASDVQTYLQDQAIATFATTAARDAAITSPSEGMFAYSKADDAYYVYSGSAWIPYDIGWTAWTPTFTGFVQGTGAVTQAYYTRIGKTVIAQVYVTLGTTPTITAGFAVSLPIDHSSSNRSLAVGNVLMRDSVGARNYSGIVYLIGSAPARAQFQALNASATYQYQVSQTTSVPHSWTSGDYFSFTIAYQGV